MGFEELLNKLFQGGKPSAGPGSKGNQVHVVPATTNHQQPATLVECQRCMKPLPINEAIHNKLKRGSYLHQDCARCDECDLAPLDGWECLKREGRSPDAGLPVSGCPIPFDRQSRMLFFDKDCRIKVGARMREKCTSCRVALGVPEKEVVRPNAGRGWHLECWFCPACNNYFSAECIPIFLDNALLCSRDRHGLKPGSIPQYLQKQIQRIPTVRPEKGGNCYVHQGREEGRNLVALRTLIKQDEKSVDKFKRQSLLWWRVADQHKNLIRLLGYWTEHNKIYAVYPWAVNGTLSSYVRNHRQDAIELLHGAVSGLSHLHSRVIIHGDISGSNILVGDKGVPMISDPDLVKIKGSNTTTSSRKQASELHRAPEIEAGQSKTEASDAYAFGITIAETLSGGELYGNKKRTPFTPLRPPEHIMQFGQMEGMVWNYGAICWEEKPQSRLRMDDLERRLKQDARLSGSSVSY